MQLRVISFVDATLLETLLNENECTFLDFKRAQYPFSNATEVQKAELLKDIIAFSNQNVRETGYIVIGAQEKRGHRAVIMGVTEHLEEHSIQQFVNSKTNRPVSFRYCVVPCDNQTLGVIEIPSQPFIFLKNDYGDLRKLTCYVRRGSSTAEMDPEEVVRRAEQRVTSKQVPVLSFSFAQIKLDYVIYSPLVNENLPNQSTLRTVSLALPENEYPEPPRLVAGFDFQKFGEFLRTAHFIRPIGFSIENLSGVAALDIHCHVRAPSSDHYKFFSQGAYPLCPTWPRASFGAGGFMMRPPDGDITVQTQENFNELGWIVPKILPGQTIFSAGTFLIWPKRACRIKFEVKIFGENLTSPFQTSVESGFECDDRDLSIKEYRVFLEHFKQRRSPFP